MTFDTSVIDVQKSFSSTETNTSGSTGKENLPPSETNQIDLQPAASSREVSTEELYDQWASTYDTDGNVLQYVDDLQMDDMLDRLVALCSSSYQDDQGERLQIMDLGCGTGRNTVKVLQLPWPSSTETLIHAVDYSMAMLDIARVKCERSTNWNAKDRPAIRFAKLDISDTRSIATLDSETICALISTLVLEHIPIATYFAYVSHVLKPGGYAVLTNMHSDMGEKTIAGFRTASGERVKGTSYVYTPSETVEAAQAAGLELIGKVKEGAVEAAMIDGGVLQNGRLVEKGAVREGARKWVGTKAWYGMLLRKN
jgi:SAM-dependent methyltransferase